MLLIELEEDEQPRNRAYGEIKQLGSYRIVRTHSEPIKYEEKHVIEKIHCLLRSSLVCRRKK